jgi:glycosyltransferase involved in cell wall biosynthesis
VADAAASLVLPVLRQEDAWLERAVRSGLGQTAPCEVVVVTAPATPRRNRAVLARLADGAGGRLIVLEAPPGFARALNCGFRAARAPRVGLLLSDDWLEPTAVEVCLGVSADIVSTWKRSYAADGATEFPQLRRRPRLARFEALPTLEARADYLTHFFLLRRALVLGVGGADETLGDTAGIDDYDLIWVLLEHGASVTIVERFCYNRRDHTGDRLTTRPQTEILATLERILDKHGVLGPERERLLRAKARWFGRPAHVVAAGRDRGSPR